MRLLTQNNPPPPFRISAKDAVARLTALPDAKALIESHMLDPPYAGPVAHCAIA
jgi:hypothetical protein